MNKLILLSLIFLTNNVLAENKYIPYTEVVEGKAETLFRMYLNGMNDCYSGYTHSGGSYIGNYYSDINEGVMSDHIGWGRELDKVKVKQIDSTHVEVSYLVRDVLFKNNGDERIKVLVDWAKKGKYECMPSPEVSEPKIGGS